MKKLKIGDKVYSAVCGPDSTGTVVSIEENKDGNQFIEIELDKPIKKIAGWDKLFISVNE